MVSDKFAFPAALQWKGVSDLVTAVFGGPEAGRLLTTSIVWSMAIAGFAALVMEVLRIRTQQPLSALAARDRPRRGDAAGLVVHDVPAARRSSGYAGAQAADRSPARARTSSGSTRRSRSAPA